MDPSSLSRYQRAYLDFYGIHADSENFRFGTFESGGLTLSCQLLHSPTNGKGTVILVHGYLDHSGCLRHLINRLAAEGYNVAVYDHPGHGLSEGKQVSIDDFATYESAFSDLLAHVRSRMPPPYDVVAHSMGGTVVVDHLLNHPDSSLRRVVLVAPMIRDATPWVFRRFGHTISPLVDYLPRIAEKTSSDLAFCAGLKTDPLESRVVSTRWSRSFIRWQRKSLNAPQSTRSPLITEAEIDTVIDGAYTHQWLHRTFPASRFVQIEGGRHHLLNEAQPLREHVLDIVSEELRR